VEDQPTDSGDLTTDAAETPGAADAPDAPDAKAARRKHRMPLRKQMAAGASEAGEAQPDEVSSASEVTTAVTEEPVASTPRRRRWFSLRRGPKPAEPEADSAAESTAAQPKPASRVPVGKAARVKTDEAVEPAVSTDPKDSDVSRVSEVAEDSHVPEPEVSEPAAADPAASDAAEAPLQEVTFVAHRPAGKGLIRAAVAAGVLFVGAAGFAGATLQPYLAERAEVATKLDVARTAASAISTLWTYTPDNLETLPDRSAGFLGGDFAYEYRNYIDAIVAPNKQAQVTNTTQVLGAAVESLTRSEATAIVYTNSVATSPMTKNIPSLRYLSYRLTMEHRDAKWLITKMSTVTSLDLTPQL
jgi:Mce-associated membrane protein